MITRDLARHRRGGRPEPNTEAHPVGFKLAANLLQAVRKTLWADLPVACRAIPAGVEHVYVDPDLVCDFYLLQCTIEIYGTQIVSMSKPLLAFLVVPGVVKDKRFARV